MPFIDHYMTQAGECDLCEFKLFDSEHRRVTYPSCHPNHPGCRKVVTGTAIQELAQVNYYAFPPRRRRHERNKVLFWARSALTDALSIHFSKSTSNTQVLLSRTSEALRPIAEYLLPEYLTLTANDQFSGRRGFCFLISKPVWAEKKEYRGTKYVTALTNNRNEIRGEAINIIQPYGKSKAANVIYVATNHLGVVQVVITDSTTRLKVDQVPDIWWHAIDIPCRECCVQANYDGVKIRQLFNPEICDICFESRCRYQSNHLNAFTVPTHPERLRWIRNSWRSYGRMMSATFNNPNMTGLSTSWPRLDVILVHGPGEEADIGTRSQGSTAVYIYTPFDEGELVTEIWVGCMHGSPEALGMKTTKGRTICHAQATQLDEISWVLADVPQGSVSTMHYRNDMRSVESALAFESPPPSSRSFRQFDPMAVIPPVPTFPYCDEGFFGGSVDLTNVVEVTPCRMGYQQQIIISGMIFRFEGGHREALGQIRLDGLQKPMPFGSKGCEFLHLKFGYTHEVVRGIPERSHLLDAQFAEFEEPQERDPKPGYDPARDGHRYLDISRKGILQWWWSHSQSHLIYEGRASLQPREGWMMMMPGFRI